MIYLDNAATSFPKPPEVIGEMSRCMREYCGNPGRGSNKLAFAAAEKIYDCRAILCDFFSAESPENVIFCQNATHALNIAILSLARDGAHFICSDMEHNSVRRPLEYLARERGCSYSVFVRKCQRRNPQPCSGIQICSRHGSIDSPVLVRSGCRKPHGRQGLRDHVQVRGGCP